MQINTDSLPQQMQTLSGTSAASPAIPRPEYPRPQLVREAWANLNGTWEFAFDDANVGLAESWHDGRRLEQSIVVPFAYQTPLSGINDKGIHEVVWYARDFTVPDADAWRGKDILLHFGAVDYKTTVWINGVEVGHNRGGHVPFTFDITPYLRAGSGAVQHVCVRVEDRQDAHQPRGKQSVTGLPHGIDYYCTTGIWQTVWLEPVSPMRIESIAITPILAAGVIVVDVYLHAPAGRWQLAGELRDGNEIVGGETIDTLNASAQVTFELSDPTAWTPDNPYLYDIRIALLAGRDGRKVDSPDAFEEEKELDVITSYAGLVDVALDSGKFLLNDKPTYLAMVLDQGYWPDGGMTAPTDDALRADVEWCKQFGFNGARKHQKLEDPRWLYWCDKLGLLTWGEMPNARAWSSDSEEALAAEWERVVRRDSSHACLVAWVPVNESMDLPALKEDHPGQYAFLERMVHLTRLLDPARPVIDNDGWEHTDVTDIVAIHDYSHTGAILKARYTDKLAGGAMPPRTWTGSRAIFARGATYHDQPVMLTEVGGFLALPDLPNEQLDRMYQIYAAVKDGDELSAKYEELMEGIAGLPFVSGFCYTQLTDIEQEINGLLTCDRKPKVDLARIAAIHARLFHKRKPSA